MNRARRAIRIALLTPAVLLLLLLALYAMNAMEASHDGRFAMGIVVMLYFFLAAPILHLAGLIMGILGLRKHEKGAMAGTLLNIAVPAAGTFLWLVVLVLPNALAFR